MPRAERPPSFQFYPRDYMSDPAVQSLTWDQRGRYHWALCCSALASTPGEASESDWARWMGYSPDEWQTARAAHLRCFNVRTDGMWWQERMRRVRAVQRARFKQSKEAGRLSGVARRLMVVNGTRTERERNANEKPTPASASASALEAKHVRTCISIPLDDGTEFEVSPEQEGAWQEAYPMLVIRGCLLSAQECNAKRAPKDRWTRRGVVRALLSWFKRELTQPPYLRAANEPTDPYGAQ